MRRVSPWAVFLISVATGAGLTTCVRAVRPPVPEPVSPKVSPLPAGCDADLSGRYVHAEDPSWTYDAIDDGGQVTLRAAHLIQRDAGFQPRRFVRDGGLIVSVPTTPPDGGPADAGPEDPTAPWVELWRTDAGLRGTTHAVVRHPSGKQCAVEFETAARGCARGLELETADGVALNARCERAATEGNPSRTHLLIRAGNDAGGDPSRP